MKEIDGGFCGLRLPQLYDTDGRCCAHQPWFGRIIAYASRGLDLNMPAPNGIRNFMHISDAVKLMIIAWKQKVQGIFPIGHPDVMDYYDIANIAYQEFNCGGKITIDKDKIPFKKAQFPSEFELYSKIGCIDFISISECIKEIKMKGMSINFGPLDVK
jgi:nucleoside-diphosphate-sugar epimerase